MDQWLKALVAIPEGLRLVRSIHEGGWKPPVTLAAGCSNTFLCPQCIPAHISYYPANIRPDRAKKQDPIKLKNLSWDLQR